MKVISLVVGLTVGVLLMVGLVSPVVADGQITAGDAAEVTNAKPLGANYTYKIWDGSDIELTYVASTQADTPGTYSVNGVEVPLVSAEQRIIIASNDFASRSGGGIVGVLNSQYVSSTTQFSNDAFTFTVADGEYTLVLGSVTPVTYTGKVDWLVYAANDGDAGLIQCSNVNAPFYTSNQNKIIVLGNIYTTGENDTFYSYYNGDLTVNEAYADNSSVSIEKTLVSGYTDIYNTTIEVNVDNESFTPFFILIPETVTGHETSGANYALLKAIPIVALIALIAFAAFAVRGRMND